MTASAPTQTLDALFSDGVVRLVEDDTGWEGFRREETDGEVAYYYVDTRDNVPSVRNDVRVGERAVRETLRERLQDDLELAVADGGGSR